jgi:hypothetical protein
LKSRAKYARLYFYTTDLNWASWVKQVIDPDLTEKPLAAGKEGRLEDRPKTSFLPLGEGYRVGDSEGR